MDPTAVFGYALPAEISNILATLQLQTNILRSSYANILKFPAIAHCFKGTNFSFSDRVKAFGGEKARGNIEYDPATTCAKTILQQIRRNS